MYYGNISNTDVEITPGDRSTYAADLQSLSDVFRTVRNILHQGYERNQKTYNLRKRDIQFYVGDRVWRKNSYF